VRGYLLGANCLEQSFHVVVVAVHKGVSLSVVGMHISALHLSDLVRVVAFAVRFLVLGLGSTHFTYCSLTLSWAPFGAARCGL